METKNFNLTITKQELPDPLAANTASLSPVPPTPASTLTVNTACPEEILDVLKLAGVPMPVAAEVEEEPEMDAPEDVAAIVAQELPADAECEVEPTGAEDEVEIVSEPGEMSGEVPLLDDAGDDDMADMSDASMDDQEGAGGPEDSASLLSELMKLSGLPQAVTESTLIETAQYGAQAVDFLHKVGKAMLDKASNAGSLKGLKDNDPKFVELNNMSRIGELLIGLGEPFSTPLSKFDRADLEYIAKKLNVPYAIFAKKVGLREGVAKLVPYQGKNVFEPMSKKQVLGDQPLVNNTGDNSMVNPEDNMKRLKVMTVKESLNALKGLESQKKNLNELEEVNSDVDSPFTYANKMDEDEEVISAPSHDHDEIKSEVLTPEEIEKTKESIQNGDRLPDEMLEKWYDHFYHTNEMPYGTLKARDGDPEEWIYDYLDRHFGPKEVEESDHHNAHDELETHPADHDSLESINKADWKRVEEGQVKNKLWKDTIEEGDEVKYIPTGDVGVVKDVEWDHGKAKVRFAQSFEWIDFEDLEIIQDGKNRPVHEGWENTNPFTKGDYVKVKSSMHGEVNGKVGKVIGIISGQNGLGEDDYRIEVKFKDGRSADFKVNNLERVNGANATFESLIMDAVTPMTAVANEIVNCENQELYNQLTHWIFGDPDNERVATVGEIEWALYGLHKKKPDVFREVVNIINNYSHSEPVEEEKSYSIDDVRKAEHTLEPMKCKHCGSSEVVHHQGVNDAICQDCGQWQDGEEMDEKAPPGMERWVKKNKGKFKKEYGAKKGEEVLYATAWKHHNESVAEREATLLREMAKICPACHEDPCVCDDTEESKKEMDMKEAVDAVSPTGYYAVSLWGNWFTGRYHDYGTRHAVVPGATAEEALAWVHNNAQKIYDYFRKARGHNGRLLLRQPADKNLFLDKTTAKGPSELTSSRFEKKVTGTEVDEGAGPSPGAVKYHMRKAKAKAAEYAAKHGVKVTPRLSRASNGEAAIMYDIEKDGKKETKHSLNEAMSKGRDGVGFHVKPNGNLVFTVDEKGREFVSELLEDFKSGKYNWDQIWSEVMDPFQANGQLQMVSPEQVGAMTEAPMVTDELEIADNGEVAHVGKVWWYPNYMVSDPLEVLLRDGQVEFTLGD